MPWFSPSCRRAWGCTTCGPAVPGRRRCLPIAQVSRLAPALAGGGGLALRLGRQAALLLELQAVALTTVTPVMVADQQVARVGRPAALLSLGLLASL